MKDETYFRSCCHEVGHSLAAFLLTGAFGSISMKLDGGVCYTRMPTEWPVNDHKFLVYDSLVTAGGIAAECLTLGSCDRSKVTKDMQDLDASCAELSSLPLYKSALVSTLTDMLETSARALLMPHTNALDFLAHQVYTRQEWTGAELYEKMIALLPQYKEGTYAPVLQGTSWLKGWDALLARAERLPDPLAEWHNPHPIAAKAQRWRKVAQSRDVR